MAGLLDSPPSLSPHSSTHEQHSAAQTTILPRRRWTRDYDEKEDVSVSRSRRARNMNQSFISLIAQVSMGSQFSPETLFESTSNGPSTASRRRSQQAEGRSRTLSQQLRSPLTQPSAPKDERRRDDRFMLQSSPALARPNKRRHLRGPSDPMLQSQILPPPSQRSPPKIERNVPPSPSSSQASTPTRLHQADPAAAEVQSSPSSEANVSPLAVPQTSLSEQLASMFDLDTEEELTAEFPCTLLQDIQQPGYLYLLKHHICFYAYLPLRKDRTVKSGFLQKQGRRNPRYNRYWFIMRGDVLSYYTNQADTYFPRNTIDLRSGVSTEVQLAEADGSTRFSIVTPQETYELRAEDHATAEEWIEQIKKVTFRSHHTGDSIKLKIPLMDVIEIEDACLGQMANMLSIKFMPAEEDDVEGMRTVEEYFFSFLGADPESLQKLQAATRASASPEQSESKIEASGLLQDVSLDDPPTDTATDAVSLDRLDGHGSNSDPAVAQSSFLRRQIQEPSSLSSSQQTITRPISSARNDSTTSINGLYRASAERLRQASGLAGAFGKGSKRVGSMLTKQSKSYYGKAAGMWTGNVTRYGADEKPVLHRHTDDEDNKDGKNDGDSFRQHFALPISEKLQAAFFVNLQRSIPIYGKLYVGTSKLCFRSLGLPRTKMILPLRDIENVKPENSFSLNLGSHGLVLVVRGHEEIFFGYSKRWHRDECLVVLGHAIDANEPELQLQQTFEIEKQATQAAELEHEILLKARRRSLEGNSSRTISPSLDKDDGQSIIFDDLEASVLDFTPPSGMNIVCLTIGSRGDVQPYIALCKGLLKLGHKPVVATHAEFEPWIRSHGIEFRLVAGDPGKIMQLCVENDMFTYQFLKEAQSFRTFLDELFVSSWEASQGADILIESPSVMAGIHIAEALNIPYYRAFTMPWSPTRAYPHAFFVLDRKMGGTWNYMTYQGFNLFFWQATAHQLNRFRVNTLGLPKTTLKQLRADEVPFVYNFSPSVVTPPMDFGPHIHLTGYWFLDEGSAWQAPAELLRFIQKARRDHKKLVYIGFGSVVVDSPAAMTRAVTEAVQDADVRCIMCKGWSDRLDKRDASWPEIPLPDAICSIKAAPHDWLFSQVDAAVHHGGAGTTGASLRAGIPTVVKPFFGDQKFFGSRVEDLGVGVCLKAINSRGLAQALTDATTDERMIKRARRLGEKIRSEDGVTTAIKMIFRDLEYARSITDQRCANTKQHTEDEPPQEQRESDESWDMLSEDGELEEIASADRLRTTTLDFEASLGNPRRSGYGYDGRLSSSARSSASGIDVYDEDGP